MSTWSENEPICASRPSSPALATIIDARPRDLGGFSVRRLLPAAARRLVGPFIFFDHMGPAALAPGAGMDVCPHPHIGLATVTYLYEGEIIHRDSLGSHQPIRPGEINWMTAGRGIVHSERTSPELRRTGTRVHGLQLWVALPLAHEEVEPAFDHYPADALPAFDHERARIRLLAGAAYGRSSPVRTFSPLFYVDAALPAGRELPLPDEHEERAAYVVEGAVECGDERAEPGRMLVFSRGAQVRLRALSDARIALVGGAPLDGERHIWWNFVSSSKQRIEQAKREWVEARAGARERNEKDRRFPSVPGDELEFIPPPE